MQYLYQDHIFAQATVFKGFILQGVFFVQALVAIKHTKVRCFVTSKTKKDGTCRVGITENANNSPSCALLG
jgi:hypothetical protein